MAAMLGGCSSTNGLGPTATDTEALCEPNVTGTDTASTVWDSLPKTFRPDTNTCSYFAARRGICGTYAWIQFETGGIGDSTLMYFDAAGSVVYTELTFDTPHDCSDGTKDIVCHTGCKPMSCEGTITESIAPGSAKAPEDCQYNNPGLW
jgi:hypothetical protein